MNEIREQMRVVAACEHEGGWTKATKYAEKGKMGKHDKVKWVKWMCKECFGWYDEGTGIFGVYCG